MEMEESAARKTLGPRFAAVTNFAAAAAATGTKPTAQAVGKQAKSEESPGRGGRTVASGISSIHDYPTPTAGRAFALPPHASPTLLSLLPELLWLVCKSPHGLRRELGSNTATAVKKERRVAANSGGSEQDQQDPPGTFRRGREMLSMLRARAVSVNNEA
jgi:hypothetical protein